MAEELHFARAATRLGIEQSPLSRQIRDLEADLRVRLFDRTRRSTTLTRAGERLKRHARRILDDVETSIADVQVFAGTLTGPLRLGLGEGAACAGFGRFLRLCAASEPSVPIVLRERSSASLLESLATGGLDAMFSLAAVPPGEFRSEVVWSEPLMLVTSNAHPGREGSAKLSDFAHARWLLPDPSHLPGAAVQLEELFARHGIIPRDPILAGSPQCVIRLAAAGSGVGLLPYSMAETFDQVAVRPVDDRDAVITTWMTIRAAETAPITKFAVALAKSAAEP